jgi:hypothetical protein
MGDFCRVSGLRNVISPSKSGLVTESDSNVEERRFSAA